MKVDVLLGLQWGDEGKGKVVDVLTPRYDVVARFQGGPNAGHTLEFEGQKYVLRSIPSGIFQGDKVNIIGNGVVLDPALFKAEAESLEASGHNLKERLHISKKAHLILPTHRILDAAYEAAKGDAKVGTTGKGIGPTYTDKISRNGVRVGDILHDFDKKYAAAKARHEQILKGLNYEYDITEMEKAWFEGIEYLKQFQLVDSEHEMNNLLAAGKSVLCEGAQGTMLDIDFGSYPFVTSSNTVCAGACTGLGIAPNKIGEVYGIFKAYCTRVGAGPFPTELFDKTGDQICTLGHEFGSVTGRKLPGQELLVDGDLCQLLGREVGAVLLCEDRGGIGTLLGQFGDDFQDVGIGQLGDFRARGLGLDDILLGIAQCAQAHGILGLHGLHDTFRNLLFE